MLRVVRVLAVVGAAGLLAACTSGSGYSDLDREATSADVLPSDLPGYATEGSVEGSVRFTGEHDGVEYFLYSLEPGDGTLSPCVVAYRSADEWVGGCGVGLTLGGIGLTVVVAPDGSPELDVGTPVGANIVVR
jgi:hypothetical protein